ncbi:MAG: UvrB/UvrC motif-containing protein [Planctomycetota bacterium]
MISVDRELIYVGESKSLRNRLLSYFTGEPASAKLRRIVEEADCLVWERTGHEFTALLRELELIRRWQPRFNVRGNPGRARRAYLCVGRGPASHAYLSVRPCTCEGWTFGPLPASRQYRRSLRRLNDCFGLRDCRRRSEMLFSDQMELFSQERDAKCIRGAVGMCLAPCATACSQLEYRDRIGAALDFLAGRDTTVLDRLQKEMRSAARSQRFELAARLRDAHEDLARLSTFLHRLREVHRYSFIYPARGHGRSENWYLIREGQIVGVEQGPRNRRTSSRCLKALGTVFPSDDRTRPPTAPEDLDVVLLVARWFRKHPGELEAVLSPEGARGICGERPAF